MTSLLILLLVYLQAATPQTPERLLILGDSHMVGHFGEHLHKGLHALRRFEVMSVGIGGAGSIHYTLPMKNFCCGYKIRHTKTGDSILPTQPVPRIEHSQIQTGEIVGKAWNGKLDSLLIDYSPDVVLIALGSNYANNHSKLIEIIQKRAPSAQIIWVGPFNRSNLGPRLTAIRKANPDGSRFTFLPTHDLAGHDTLASFHLTSYSAKKVVDKLIPRLLGAVDSLFTQ